MTKTKLTAIAATTWVGGLVATGALAYTLNRPLAVAPPPLDPPRVTLTPLEPVDVSPPEPERLIVLPTIEIVGSAPVAHVAAVPRAMHCSDWRPLEQGGNSVQICE